MDERERQRRRAFIQKSYDFLDISLARSAAIDALDPNRPCPMEAWEELRHRSQSPEPQPQPRRQPAVDSARGRDAWDGYIDQRADERIAAAYDGWFGDEIAKGLAGIRRRCNRDFETEIATLRRELDGMWAELKMIERKKAAVVTGAIPDRRYRIHLTMSDGSLGPALNLRPIFELYHQEANS